MADERTVLGPDDYDEFARGPLQREFHRRCGFDPRLGVGFRTFVQQLKAAENGGHEWPDQFRALLKAVVREEVAIEVAPVLLAFDNFEQRMEDERMHTLAMCETAMLGLLDDGLEPVRKAFANIREQLKRRPAVAGR